MAIWLLPVTQVVLAGKHKLHLSLYLLRSLHQRPPQQHDRRLAAARHPSDRVGWVRRAAGKSGVAGSRRPDCGHEVRKTEKSMHALGVDCLSQLGIQPRGHPGAAQGPRGHQPATRRGRVRALTSCVAVLPLARLCSPACLRSPALLLQTCTMRLGARHVQSTKQPVLMPHCPPCRAATSCGAWACRCRFRS